ncbi:alpha/beta hydrolase [Amycolatopsis aidingensis]|uniref:alpha/beta hydrolase n=1 Tax=Amycolatopsis aidingensis TaxID=2842453 RepID=UPI001C0AAB0B|nr:alpha/beta hydrolase [Amycolatopsis aidingensis]
MRQTFLARKALGLAITANAIRPVRGARAAVPTFLAGMLATELAPQLLALNLADTAAHVARHGIRGRADRAGLAMAAASAGGLGAAILSAQRARGEVETALVEALGPGYADRLGPPPRPAGIRRDRDIAYAPGGRRFLLDVYRPRVPEQPCPVLLQVHGGAWMYGSKDLQGLPLMVHLARRGWVCVAINYPLSPAARWPAHIVAAKRAVAWIREHIADYGGDPARLAVTGGSAGGHLAALLALTADDPRFQPGFAEADTSVQACVPHYGVYDFAASSGSRASTARLRAVLARRIVGKDPEEFRADYLAGSPLDRVTGSAPPFLVLHGERDSLVPVREAREFTRRLREVSANPVGYAELSGAQHAFDLLPSIRGAHVIRGVARFLEATVRPLRTPDPLAGRAGAPRPR